MDKDKKKYTKSKAEKQADEILRANLKKKRQLEGRGGVCGALGIDIEERTHLSSLGKKRSPIKQVKRLGEKDKEMVSVEILKTRYKPDGTERFPDLRVRLGKGAVYSLPVSVAKILIEDGTGKEVKKL